MPASKTMKTLYSKILRGLGVPVILFVIGLLIINFFYVGHQLKILTYNYLNSIARQADGRLSIQVKEIEELANVLTAYLRSEQSINAPTILELLDSLLVAGEEYGIFIVRKPWVIEGSIKGNLPSNLRMRRFDDSDEPNYLYYLQQVDHRSTWSHIRSEANSWQTSYITSFQTPLTDSNGIVAVRVSLYNLVKNSLTTQAIEQAKILLTVLEDNGTRQTLLLDAKSPYKPALSLLDMSDKINIPKPVDNMNRQSPSPPDITYIEDPLDGEGQVFISQLSSHLGPDMQFTVLLPTEEALVYLYKAKLVEVIIVLIAFLGLLLLILVISKSIVRPISAFGRKVEALATGDLNVRFPETDSCLELNDLSHNLNQTVKRLKKYFSDLKRVTAKNERINSEMNISRDVQMSLLPYRRGQAQFSNIDIHACIMPAKEVGGDFYYFSKIDQDRLALVVGDVSGKGMPAAIMMSVCLSLFKAQSANTPQPDVCLEKINQLLMQEDTEQTAFITLFYGLINLSQGELVYANAGHNPPLMVGKDSGVQWLDQQHGVALAVLENARYKTHKVKFKRGDTLLLYSDGITEAHNINAEEFGEQRLFDCLSRYKEMTTAQSARGCAQNVLSSVSRFARGQTKFDDMTLLCAVLKEESEKRQRITANRSLDDTSIDISEWRNLTFQHQTAIGYDIEAIGRVMKLIDSFCRDYRIKEQIAADLCVVADEFVSNIIRHNEVSEQATEIKLHIAKQGDSAFMVLEYRGNAFDPSKPWVLDMHEDGHQQQEGGRGIYIAQQIIDHIAYTHSVGHNVLMVEKKLHN